jgi:hypothetical protein
MDHIGIDVHKRDSQIYILAEGGRSSSSGSAPRASKLKLMRRIIISHNVALDSNVPHHLRNNALSFMLRVVSVSIFGTP